MISTMSLVRVLEINPDTLYMGEPYGAYVTVEMQDGSRLVLFYDRRECPLSLLWKVAMVEISSGICEDIEKIPDSVQRPPPGIWESSSFKAWGTIVRIWTTLYGTHEWRYGLVDFGIGTITVGLPERDPEDFREGDYVHVRTAPAHLGEIYEVVGGESDAVLPGASIRDVSEAGETAPITIEFFIDEEHLSPEKYQIDPLTGRPRCDLSPRDAEDAPWMAWLEQQGSFSLKIGEDHIFREGTGTHGSHFIDTSLFSVLGLFTQSCLELLDGQTVSIWPCSSSCPHLVMKPCGHDLLMISVIESDIIVIPGTAVMIKDYLEAVIGAVDRYLRQAIEIHPHVSRTPYPRVLADRRNEVMQRCYRRGILPCSGKIMDYDALVDRAWRAYRPIFSPAPEGNSHISFGVTFTDGNLSEEPLVCFSISIDGQALLNDLCYDKLAQATLFVWLLLSSVEKYLEGKACIVDLKTPDPRTITLMPGEEGTILFSLDNMYLPGFDARNIPLRFEDWIEAIYTVADTYLTLVDASPLWGGDLYARSFLAPRLGVVWEEYQRCLERRSGEQSRTYDGRS